MPWKIPTGSMCPPNAVTCKNVSTTWWALLVIGLAMRCVALNQPLIDAHLIRQCQTAAATQSLHDTPGFALSAEIPWIGDLQGRYILELPLYNYLVLGAHLLIPSLDASGKITSILLWAASFFLLQGIWRRLLSHDETFWANLLFVISPLGVFYSQAIMPEMLVQLLAFGFLLAAIQYSENPTATGWLVVAATGLLGLLVKLPEVSHLYLILAVLIFRLEGWRGMFRPRYLLAAAITAGAVKLWGNYTNSVNGTYLPEWTSERVLAGFIGPLASRLTIRPWAMIVLYNAAFIAAGPAVLAMLHGLRTLVRRHRCDLLALWLISLVPFYLIWFGNGGTAQSYYNLPSLAPLCALFGIGMSAFWKWEGIVSWRKTAATTIAIALMLCTTPVLFYLFKQDREIFAASNWIRDHTQPDDLTLIKMNHRWDMVDYYYNPVPAYYSHRHTFIVTRFTPEEIRKTALDRSRYAVVTLSQPARQGVSGAVNRFRGVTEMQPESFLWLTSAGFAPFKEGNGFIVYKKP